MNQNKYIKWTKIRLISIRFFFCYLLFYFLFLSNVYVSFFPFVEHVHRPFKYISDSFISLVNRFLIHKHFDADIYTGLGDTSWFFMAAVIYIIIAIVAAFIWTLVDKGKNYKTLFIILHTYARYYLAFILLAYGLAKLFETQFVEPPPDYLIQPLGNIVSHTLMWTFMGASESYNYFSGLLETIAGLFLLFRRTAIFGALVSITIFTQVLFLNIGYDTLVKALVAHLLFINLFILSPAARSLWNFFMAKKSASLTTYLTIKVKPEYRWIRYGLKAILIGFVVFGLLKSQIDSRANYTKSYFGGIDGIYEAKEFFRNQQALPPLTTDTLRWRRIAINKFGNMAVQFMNDSTAQYGILVDTMTRTMALNDWNDSTFKSKLHYSIISPAEYLFEGSFKHDSIKIVAQKRRLDNLPLLRDKGKIKWVWW